MNIERVVVGYLMENCYILDIDKKVLIIDPGDESKKIIDKIGKREVLGILITLFLLHHFQNRFIPLDVFYLQLYFFLDIREATNANYIARANVVFKGFWHLICFGINNECKTP